MPSKLKKEMKKIRKEEEVVVLKIGRFRIRKKLFFSLFLSILVAAIGFSKVESLHEIGMHITPLIVLITSVICSLFLFFTVVKKNIHFITKQVLLTFSVLFLLFRLITIKGPYSLTDLLFISIIVTTISVSIYDIF